MFKMEIEKYLKASFSFFFVISVILLIIAAFAWQEFFVTGALFTWVGAAELVISGAALLRLRSSSGDQMYIGRVGIQHSWMILSIGLAGSSLFLAPYFDIGIPVIIYGAFIIALLYLVLGAYSLYKTRMDTNQFLSI